MGSGEPSPPVQPDGPALVDWTLAGRIARRVAGRDPFHDSYLSSSLTSDFATFTEEAAGLVSEYTRLPLPDPGAGIVLSRAEWVDTNVRSMQRLLHPLAERFGKRMGPFGFVSRGVAGTESGVLLGIMAQRVLGQYDVFFADATGADAVFYVGGNVLTVEKRYAFRPRDFRMWIALHEVTHRAQFTGVPWLRGYFLDLIDRLLGSVDPDPTRVIRTMRESLNDLRSGNNPMEDGGIVALLASPEQRAVLRQMQALMSLLEGHGNAVMNALGRTHVHGQERMATTLAARRNGRGISGLVQKLLGLDAKLRQYDIGERFITTIEAEAGPRALDPAWRAPECLPTLAELDAPLTWLARVDATDATLDGR